MWGDGKQTRSFTYIDDCVEGVLRITKSDCREPLNLGSSEMVRSLAPALVAVRPLGCARWTDNGSSRGDSSACSPRLCCRRRHAAMRCRMLTRLPVAGEHEPDDGHHRRL